MEASGTSVAPPKRHRSSGTPHLPTKLAAATRPQRSGPHQAHDDDDDDDMQANDLTDGNAETGERKRNHDEGDENQ